MAMKTGRTAGILVAGMVFSHTFLFGCRSPGQGAIAADVSSAQSVSPENVDRPVNSIRLLKRGAARPEWSPSGEYVTYHARGADRFYDVHIMRSDWTDARCLTCDHGELPDKRHMGEPSWHPSGEWIVFKVQKEKHVLQGLTKGLAEPGIGYHNDVWIMKLDTKKVYRLTNLKTKMNLLDPTPTSGVLHPHFSGDGKKISWSEKIGDGGKWGAWGVRVGDFKVGPGGVPSVANMRVHRPGVNQLYYESNDFMPQGRKMLICGNLEPNQTEIGIDIYYLDLATGKTQRLTHSLDAFDECPHPSPDGKKIAFLSTRGFDRPPGGSQHFWWNWVQGEFWIMDANGANPTQLTYFNTPGFPEYTGDRVIPAYVAWNNTGDKLLLGVSAEKGKKEFEDQLYLVELKK